MEEEEEGSWVEGREKRRNKRVVEGWERRNKRLVEGWKRRSRKVVGWESKWVGARKRRIVSKGMGEKIVLWKIMKLLQ